MFHNSMAVLAISREPNPMFFQKTIALNDSYFGMEGFDFPMDNIQMVGKLVGEMYKGEKPLETALAPIGLLNEIACHAVDFWLATEDLPDPNNRVTVHKAGHITLTYTHRVLIPTAAGRAVMLCRSVRPAAVETCDAIQVRVIGPEEVDVWADVSARG
jgi:hypothetical protein